MAKKPQQFSSICAKNQQLTAIRSRVRQLSQLNTILLEVLPEQFINHCRLANVSPSSIVIHTDNASLASLLRFQTSQICQALSNHLPYKINRLDVKVRPTLFSDNTEPKQSHVLSASAAQSLQQTAELLEESPLKTALLKLSRRVN
jgi:hypothetical protein